MTANRPQSVTPQRPRGLFSAGTWLDQPLRIKGLAVVAIPFAAMLAILFSSYYVERQSAEAEGYVRLTLQIQHDIQQVHTLLESAGTGVRGYLLTQSVDFLEPYEIARIELPKTMERLRKTISDSRQKANLDAIEPLVDEKLKGLELMHAHGVGLSQEERIRLLKSNKRVLDSLRDRINTMRIREGELLTERIQTANEVKSRNLAVTVIGTVLSVISSVLGMLLFSRSIIRRTQLLEENAHRLQRGERLVPLPPGTDEIGRLAHALENASQLRIGTEEALRESEERLRLVIDGVRDFGIFALDNDGKVVSWNAGAERISGYAADEVIGCHFSMFYPEETHDTKPMEELAQARQAGRVEDEGWRVRKDGSRYWANVVITAQHDESGRLRGFSKVTRDITQRRLTEEQLLRTREEVERASNAKSEFLSRMSHELRTPLNSILGFAQLMQLEQAGAQKSERSVDHILRAGRHLLGLINEVLDISRIESGIVAMSLESVDLRELLTEVETFGRPFSDAKNISVETRFLAPAGSAVQADVQRLKQVMINLIDNAIKYNHKGGRVTITAEAVGEDRLRITISDTGIGIARPLQAKVFLPFERLGAERGSVEGTGLGLAVSRSLIEAMGGKIGFDSEIGRGSSFWLDLPRVAEIVLDQGETERSVKLSDSGSAVERKILYIEDNVSNVDLIRAILKHRPSIRLICAYDGGEGLRAIERETPDMVLLDLNLPDMLGSDVLMQIQAMPQEKAVPVIVVSADATPQQQQRMLAIGAEAYLPKPIDVKIFLALIDEIQGDLQQRQRRGA